MTRALVLLVLIALPSGALAQTRDSRREQLTDLRDHHDHETVSGGVQLRIGHAVGDAVAASPPAQRMPLGSGGPATPIGGSIEVAGLLDLRYSPRSHWRMRLAVFAAVASDRTNSFQRLHPWRVGIRWFPLAVGLGSDLVSLRLGAELGLTWTERWYLDTTAPFPTPTTTLTRVYDGHAEMLHFAPNIEVGFEVAEGWEVNLWGIYVFVAGNAGGSPLMYGEYGVSAAASFW